MRISVHDYMGHPFPFELSRALSARGHLVTHLYCDTLEAGQASFAGDHSVDIVPVSAPSMIDKGAVVSRFRNEYAYGRRLRRQLELIRPDIVVSANAPSHVQMHVQGLTRATTWKNVLWVQDLYGLAIRSVYSRRSRAMGTIVSSPFVTVDGRLLGSADHVVLISEGFAVATGRSISDPRTTVIENWSPLDEFPLVDRDNAWSRGVGAVESFNYVYSGTLGMKHEPETLVALAEAVSGAASVFVVASGVSMDWLREEKGRRGLDNLFLFGPVPYGDVPSVLGSADVLVALLERDAGVFSVPSKVLSYLCAGRPILGALPSGNLSRQIVDGANAGITVDPGDTRAFIEAANTLHADQSLRKTLATNGRDYAERTFAIEPITTRWERLLESVIGG